MAKIAIVGAGPAGLAAAAALSQSKKSSVFIFDKGKNAEDRDHTRSEDLGIGIGGAGLFSDGKISFYCFVEWVDYGSHVRASTFPMISHYQNHRFVIYTLPF